MRYRYYIRNGIEGYNEVRCRNYNDPIRGNREGNIIE